MKITITNPPIEYKDHKGHACSPKIIGQTKVLVDCSCGQKDMKLTPSQYVVEGTKNIPSGKILVAAPDLVYEGDN